MRSRETGIFFIPAQPIQILCISSKETSSNESEKYFPFPKEAGFAQNPIYFEQLPVVEEEEFPIFRFW